MRIWWLAVAALLAPCTVLAQDEARRDPSKTRVVYRVAGTERVKVRADQRFDSAGTPLAYDAYQPATDAKARPAIVFVSGASEVRGWTWYQDLGRLAAAHGMVGIVPDKRYPRGADGLRTGMADTETLLTHLRAAAPALGIDPDRICLWVFSAGGRLAALPFRENAPRIACLVAYYPILSSADLMNDPALLPAFSPAEAVARVGAPRVPTLVARAGRDSPAINATIDRFLAAALAAGQPVTLVNAPESEHGFDGYNDTEESRRIVAQSFRFVSEATRGGD